jgi:hypothetical protein
MDDMLRNTCRESTGPTTSSCRTKWQQNLTVLGSSVLLLLLLLLLLLSATDITKAMLAVCAVNMCDAHDTQCIARPGHLE